MRSYIKLDASFFRHPKAVAAGRDGRDLFIAGLCYAGDLLTDGFIPAGTLPMLGADSGVRNVKAAAEALVAAGLWEPEAGGYRAHDYRDYNSGSDEVRAKRDAARDRMQRLRSQDVRANNERSSPDVREQEQYVQQEGSIEPNGSQEPGGSPPPPNPEPEKPKRRHRLPDGWEPSQTHRESLGADGYSTAEIDAEVVKFRNHHGHKGDTGLNWALAFTNWMARSREFNRRPALTTVNGMPPEIARLPWNNAQRMKWEHDHREAS